jgi:polypeptide N-acetylgalactosaminyltransferase
MRFKIGLVVNLILVLFLLFVVVKLFPRMVNKPSEGSHIELEKRNDAYDGKDRFQNAYGGLHAFPKIPAKEIDLKSREEIDLNIDDLSNLNIQPGSAKKNAHKVLQNAETLDEISLIDYPKLNWKSMGNYEITPNKRYGAGEYGVPVRNTQEEKEKVDASIKEFGFNMVNSDKISLDRLPKDLRHEECKHWDYPDEKHLSDISVIIVFHNEGWSTLMRTVHSVINLTPKSLLGEIVLIDDHRSKEHLGRRLSDYITRFDGLVKLYRNDRREGLIRARSIGAQKSAPVHNRILVYLDAHCEVGYNWLPPLIMPIIHNRQVTTVPLIDVINGRDYTFTPQAGGDSNGFARGAWDWSMLWKRIPLTRKERERRQHTTDPYRSPAMAGGLFAIDRSYFFQIGLYDPGLEIWGGENFEMSFKIWMCGGEVLFIPCSRIGHIYRLEGWSGNPPPDYVPSNPSLRNYIRVVEVWWDEYKDYFYASRPESREMPFGDITEQVKYRQNNNCKSFKWFMDNIAYDVADHYPLPAKNIEWGEIKAIGTQMCIDSMGHKNGNGAMEYGHCHRMGGNQLFRLNSANQLAQYDQCVTTVRGMITLVHCDTTQYKEWKHVEKSFIHITSGKCLDRGELIHNIFLSECDSNKATQQWEINKVRST